MFFRVLEIVQSEEYLTAADTSIIRRQEISIDPDRFGNPSHFQFMVDCYLLNLLLTNVNVIKITLKNKCYFLL